MRRIGRSDVRCVHVACVSPRSAHTREITTCGRTRWQNGGNFEIWIVERDRSILAFALLS
jgi:hypothetical protein